MLPPKDSLSILLSIKLRQRLQTFSFAFLATLTACSMTADALPANSNVPQAWHLIQNNEEMGKVDILLTHDAVRMYSHKQKFYVLTKSPDWKIHCYRDEEKIEWIGELKTFSCLVMGNPFLVAKPYNVIKAPAGQRGNFKGLNYAKYSTGPGQDNYICATPDIKISSQVAEFIARYYNLPNTDLIPLYRCSKQAVGQNTRDNKSQMPFNSRTIVPDLRTGVVVKLSTVSWQKIPYQAKDFAYPKGYKPVPDVVRITYSADSQNQLNEMLDTIGFTESNKLTKNAAKAKDKR
ncbi:MAG: hypothetical protein IPL73_30505 [Candidatus Obscuribacter sp.]|nr:hypothetical protein [Candidatus Obscuribacter sp.]